MDDRLMYRRQFFIGGTWAEPAGGDRLGVISPSTEEVVGEVPVATTADIDRAVSAARSVKTFGIETGEGSRRERPRLGPGRLRRGRARGGGTSPDLTGQTGALPQGGKRRMRSATVSGCSMMLMPVAAAHASLHHDEMKI